MKLDMGDDVIMVGLHSISGATEHPAKITRVRVAPAEKPGSVNLHVFVDGMPSQPREGVVMYESLAQANSAQARLPFCYPKPAKA